MAISVTNIGSGASTASNASIAITVPTGGIPAGAVLCVGISEGSTAQTTAGTVTSTVTGSSVWTGISGARNNSAANGVGGFFYQTSTLNTVGYSSANTITYTKNTSLSAVAITGFYVTGLSTKAAAGSFDANLNFSTFGGSSLVSISAPGPKRAGEFYVGFLAGSSFTSTAVQANTTSWATPFNSTAVRNNSAGAGLGAGVFGGNVTHISTATVAFNPTQSSAIAWWGAEVAFLQSIDPLVVNTVTYAATPDSLLSVNRNAVMKQQTGYFAITVESIVLTAMIPVNLTIGTGHYSVATGVTVTPPNIDLGFSVGSFLSGGNPVDATTLLSCVRNSVGYARTLDGFITLFSANILRITNKGLLVEGVATNLLLTSGDLRSAAEGNAVTAWTAQATTATQSGTAVDGTSIATQITATAGTGDHERFQTVTTSAAPYAASMYLKAGTASWALLEIDGSATNHCAYFDLTNGVVGTIGTNCTASIQMMANGWYRCAIISSDNITTGAATNVTIMPATADAASVNWNAAGTETIFVWGAQIEQGSFHTSYFPTTTASATRAADVVTAISTLDADIKGTAVTLFADIIAAHEDSASFVNRFVGATGAQGLLGMLQDPQHIGIRDGVNPNLLATIGNSVSSLGGLRSASSWNALGRSIVGGGGIVATDTNTTTVGATVYIGQDDSGDFANCYIRQLSVWTSRLSDTIMQNLSNPTTLHIGMLKASKLSSLVTYALTPSLLNINRAALINPQASLFAAGIKSAGLAKTSLMNQQAGFYNVIGESLTLTPAITAVSMLLGSGTYTLTDEQLTLTKTSRASVQSGFYTLTDESLRLLRTSNLVGSAGTYSFAGKQLTLTATRRLSPQAGSYVVTAESITFTLGGLPAQPTMDGADIFVMPYRVPRSPISAYGLYNFQPARDFIISAFSMSLGTGYYVMSVENLVSKAARLLNASLGTYALTGESLTLSTVQAFALALGSGAYALTDENLTLIRSSKLGLQVGTYTLTGENLRLAKGSRLVGTAGFYTMTDEQLTLRAAHTVQPQAGFYTETGENAGLRKTSILNAQMTPYSLIEPSVSLTIPGVFSMTVTTGYYTLTDNNLTLLKTSRDNLQAGTYALTDEQLRLLKGARMSATSGTYTLTGEQLTLKAARVLNIQEIPYSLTGENATFTLTIPTALSIVVGTGYYTLTDESLTLVKTSKLTVQTTSYSLTDEALQTLKGSRLSNTTGTYTVTGNLLTLKAGHVLVPQTSFYTVTREQVTAKKGSRLTTQTVVFALTGESESFIHGRTVSLGAGFYALTGEQVNELVARLDKLAAGTYFLTGETVQLTPSGGRFVAFTAWPSLVGDEPSQSMTGQEGVSLVGRFDVTGGDP